MKNIHLIPTDKARLYIHQGKLYDHKTTMHIANGTQIPQNIYITSDEEIKDIRPHKGKWQLEKGLILNKFPDYLTDVSECGLVIMTTDQDLIKDGVQSIDDAFLEWFIDNPSCEEVEVKFLQLNKLTGELGKSKYKIIIPKEEPNPFELQKTLPDDVFYESLEPKQETLEEVIKREYETRKFNSDFPFDPQSFKLGAKWEAEQDKKYGEQDMAEAFMACWNANIPEGVECKLSFNDWFKQLKKK